MKDIKSTKQTKPVGTAKSKNELTAREPPVVHPQGAERPKIGPNATVSEAVAMTRSGSQKPRNEHNQKTLMRLLNQNTNPPITNGQYSRNKRNA